MQFFTAHRFVAKKLQNPGNFGANIRYPQVVLKPLGTFYQNQNYLNINLQSYEKS
jgi:hypothetical protein